MDQARIITMIVIVLGGILVPASYVHGVVSNPGRASLLWGGVPQRLVPVYVVSMLLSAVGFLLFSYFLLFRALQLGIRPDFRVLAVIYAVILMPSAAWMPLTFQMVSSASPTVWLAIRLVLVAVGLGALAMLITLLRLEPRPQDWMYWGSVVGSLIFFLHTMVLDAVIWPRLFLR